MKQALPKFEQKEDKSPIEKFEDRWLRFEERTPNKKTKRFDVISKCSDCIIGRISWFPQWRHYCFFPEELTVYSDRCLNGIAGFITILNMKHKEQQK